MSFHTPASPPVAPLDTLDPFGKLNRSEHSNNAATSDDDEEMEEEKTQNSSCLLDEFDAFDLATASEDPGGSMMNQPDGAFPMLPPRGRLQRCSSWSPGGGYKGNFPGPELRRSYNIDPVASQLLRACAVQEEEQRREAEEEGGAPGGTEGDRLSRSSHVPGRIPRLRRGNRRTGGGGRHACPLPQSSSWSNGDPSSPPDKIIVGPNRPSPTRPVAGRGGRVAPAIAEGAPLDCPLSPRVTVFEDAGVGLGVSAGDDDDMGLSLARPVPRKFGSMPTLLFAGSSRRSSLPRQFSPRADVREDVRITRSKS